MLGNKICQSPPSNAAYERDTQWQHMIDMQTGLDYSNVDADKQDIEMQDT